MVGGLGSALLLNIDGGGVVVDTAPCPCFHVDPATIPAYPSRARIPHWYVTSDGVQEYASTAAKIPHWHSVLVCEC